MTKTRNKKSKKSKRRTKRSYPATANIYILYTGGTIGMLHDQKKGLIPVKGNLTKLIKKMNIDHKLNIKYTIDQTDKLIDSSNLKTTGWKLILKKLFENYTKYDSFIVIHGTDTLAYTASAISFFLRGWNKPVIVTGSQIPLFEFRNDAAKNIIDSIIVSLLKIKEVLIVFGGEILRGNRSSKHSSTDFVAYKSPNYGPIGKIGVYLDIYKNKLLHNGPTGKLLESNVPNLPRIPSEWKLKDWNDNGIKIFTQTLLPDANEIPFQALVNLKPNAIILRTYGIGNAPVSDVKFMNAIKKAIKKGIIIINTTQCVNGGVNMSYYNTGRILKEMGVTSSFDMTPETTYTKLFYLYQLIRTKNVQRVKDIFATDIAGELTTDTMSTHITTYLKSYFKQYQEL
jgi:L-asparaginase